MKRAGFTQSLFLAALAFAALLATGCAAPPQIDAPGAPTEPFAITSVNVIDVEAGELLTARTILIEGDRIVDVVQADSFTNPDGIKLIDGRGKYAIPGLWDMHIHMINDGPPNSWDFYDPAADEADPRQTYLPIYLAFGVTGVREMSGGEWSLKMRNRVNAGEVYGPRQVIGSPILDGPHPLFPGDGVLAITGPDHARSQVKELHELGYDFLKPYNLLSPESYLAIHETAKELGMDVSGELPISVSAWEAAELGQRTIEHLTGIELACSSREEELRASYAAGIEQVAQDPDALDQVALWNRSEWEPIESVDPAKCARLYAHLAEHDVWVVPTLVVQRMISYPDHPQVTNNPHHIYIHKADADSQTVIDEFDPDRNLRGVYDHRASILGDVHDAGVGMLAGSDTPAGFTLHEELQIMVEGGMSPADALRSATLNPARYFGREDQMGTIAAGKLADVVLLEANPLEAIENTLQISDVVFAGRHLDRGALDRMLEQLERDARAWEQED